MNIKNRTLFIADNLDILRGINSECIDLIYMDPPFNKKQVFKAPIGSPAEGAQFKDIWTDEDIKYEWHGQIAEQHEELYQIIQASEATYDKSMKIYLTAMAVRLFEMKRILKTKGSIYLHCDPTASHYLKLVMDSLFGKDNFQNEITWNYGKTARGAKAVSRSFARNSDIILYYSKSNKYAFNATFFENKIEFKGSGYKRDEEGRCFRTAPRGDYTDESIEKLEKQGRIYKTRNGKVRIKYFEKCDDLFVYEKKMTGNVWTDIPDMMHTTKAERTGYPTQKPLKLLERIIKASSDKKDIVLDPFCGCATACVAAEKLQRQWIGIDISPSAEVITKIRLEEASEQGSLFSPIQMSDVTVTSDAPVRTDPVEADVNIQIKLPHYKTHKPTLFGMQEGHCKGCHKPYYYKDLDVDHIVAQSKGGTDNIENLQLLCGHCNATKGDGTQADLEARLKAQHKARQQRL